MAFYIAGASQKGLGCLSRDCHCYNITYFIAIRLSFLTKIFYFTKNTKVHSTQNTLPYMLPYQIAASSQSERKHKRKLANKQSCLRSEAAKTERNFPYGDIN